MIKTKVKKYLDLIENYEGADRVSISKLNAILKMVGSDRTHISIYDKLIIIAIGNEWLHIYEDNDIRTSVLDTFSRTMYISDDIFNKAMEL